MSEQRGKRPIDIHKSLMTGYLRGFCPYKECDNLVSQTHKYCHECGSKLDWDIEVTIADKMFMDLGYTKETDGNDATFKNGDVVIYVHTNYYTKKDGRGELKHIRYEESEAITEKTKELRERLMGK